MGAVAAGSGEELLGEPVLGKGAQTSLALAGPLQQGGGHGRAARSWPSQGVIRSRCSSRKGRMRRPWRRGRSTRPSTGRASCHWCGGPATCIDGLACVYCLSVSSGTLGYEAAGELPRVLPAPERLAIVAELGEQPRFVHELAGRLGISQPLVSQHLRVLRGARLVGVQRQGRKAVYSPGRPARRSYRRGCRLPQHRMTASTGGHR
jgi:DNA-binding transcriptional ArsR family regulator